jgi:hypothetical protein
MIFVLFALFLALLNAFVILFNWGAADYSLAGDIKSYE